MVSFLFWNLAENDKTVPFLGQFAASLQIDVFFLAECPKNLDSIPTVLNETGSGVYRLEDHIPPTKVRGVSRLAPSDFFPHFNNEKGDMTIWNLATAAPNRGQIQIAVVHLLSKAGGATPPDQQAVATEISREIAEYEDLEGCQDTILVGDLNMNPFDPGMVLVPGIHGTMTKRVAELPERRWREKKYRRFYNPMWGLFGDRTPGPSGTYFWESSMTSNHHWHMFDQVLLRPSLMNRLRSVQILDRVGYNLLVDDDGLPTKSHLSDHLPIYFEIDV